MSRNITFQDFRSLFAFTSIEDEPLMSGSESLVFVTLSAIFLLIGILLNCRIFTMLSSRKNGVIIDKLMVSNTVISTIGHSLVLAYYIASNIVFPMSNYIGVIGCLISAHFMDAFIRFYNFCFPVAVASLRYLFVVQNSWVRSHGMSKVAYAVIVCSIIVPVGMAVSVLFPVSDHIHYGFNRCIGRFETFFNPLRLEPINSGGHQRESHCFRTSEWVMEVHPGTAQFYLRLSWFFCCKTSVYITRVVMLGLPEMTLYYITFRHMLRHNQRTALSGIISQDIVRKRKKQNKLNIMVTFWAWLAQLVTNIIYLLLMYGFYGKARFFHSLLATCTICLNFNILPLFYTIMVDDDFKKALLRKDFLFFLK